MPRPRPRRHHVDLLAVALVMVLAAAALVIAQTGATDVASTPHNLTASGPGTVKTTYGGEPCIFCHTPHASNPVAPLWNREDPGNYYQPYESSTLVAHVGQPTGSARLCLSCHDGTIALNQTYNAKNIPGTSVYISSSDRGYIGTDLRDDHPISFVYDAALAAAQGELLNPAMIPPSLPLDHNQQLQCTTCHDPHDNSRGQFLRTDNTESGLCKACHDIAGFDASAHATSGGALASASNPQWDHLDAATVRDAGCGSCHRTHGGGGRQRLMLHEAEQDNCLNCHDGGVAGTNLVAELNKLSTHPVDAYVGVHDPLENPFTMAEHVQCVDCHNPHRTGAGTPASPPYVPPSITGVSGVTSSGVSIDEAVYEYQVCYKCHSVRNFASATITRYDDSPNLANKFSPANASYHPVEAQGASNDVPSLKQPYTTTSMIYCGSCHGSDNPDGPQGPHGSQYEPLLKAHYDLREQVVESPQAYALCYTCHDRQSILGDESFSEHRLHIVDHQTPCATCHDPHGVEHNTRLINFNAAVVGPSQIDGTGPSFVDLGHRAGSCTLSCHGADHVDQSYPN